MSRVFIFLFLMSVGMVSKADIRLICSNSGDLNGSYLLDITGYEVVLDRSDNEIFRTLYFKPFRSGEQIVTRLRCVKSKFSPFERTVMTCSSEFFEAKIAKVLDRLEMRLKGEGVPEFYRVPCEMMHGEES